MHISEDPSHENDFVSICITRSSKFIFGIVMSEMPHTIMGPGIVFKPVTKCINNNVSGATTELNFLHPAGLARQPQPPFQVLTGLRLYYRCDSYVHLGGTQNVLKYVQTCKSGAEKFLFKGLDCFFLN